MNFKKLPSVICAFIGLLFLLIYISCKTDSTSAYDHRAWEQYGGGPDQSKYFVASQITKKTLT